MIEFNFNIDKDIWKVLVLPREEYDISIGTDSEAQVDVNQKHIAFCKERITTEVIEHEMTHIYFNKCCLSSVENFTIEQVEEIVAEFIPKYARKIIDKSNKLKKTIEKHIMEDES